MDIITYNYPQKFLWNLTDSNNTILAGKDDYTQKYHYYYHNECISMIAAECSTLRLIDKSYSIGTKYIFSLDGKIIKNGTQASGLEVIKVGNCSTSNTN